VIFCDFGGFGRVVWGGGGGGWVVGVGGGVGGWGGWGGGGGSSVGIATGWTVRDRIPVGTRFSAHPDWPWGPPSLLYNGYQVFPRGKVRLGCAADHSPPFCAVVMEE